MRKFSFIAALMTLVAGVSFGDYVQKPYDSRPAPQYWDNSQPTDRSVWNYDPTPPASPDQVGNNADMRITRTIMGEIVRDNTLSPAARQVLVSTTKGIVTIKGTVPTPEEKNKLEEIARNVFGVSGIHNQIAVPHAPAPKPVNVRVLTPDEEQKIQEYDQSGQQGVQQPTGVQMPGLGTPQKPNPFKAPATPVIPGAKVVQY